MLFIEEHILIIILFQSALLLTLLFYLQRKKVLSFLFFLVSFFSISYLQSIYDWLQKLGVDSFIEAQNFSRVEALFFLKTATQILVPFTFKQVALIVFITGFTVLPIYIFVRKKVIQTGYATILAIIVFGATSVLMFAATVAKYENNSVLFQSIKNNFNHQPLSGTAKHKNLNLVIYIGESISVSNLQLYGYPRPTTPLLNKVKENNDKLLVFDKVFSTHTHTTTSLLEALSVRSGDEETAVPLSIFKRQRISLIDILNASGVTTHWISNQNKSGSWNFASSILAGNVTTKLWSTNSEFAPNSNDLLSRPYDHEFLLPHVKKLLQQNGTQAVFLHSYTGHGPYLSNIPEDYRLPVDDLMSRLSQKAVFGENHSNTSLRKDVDAYDSTMRYVDFTLSQLLKITDETKNPTVLVYFSDHGESVLTGRGHDSSRFLHEMARVPFIIYFNEAAANQDPDFFQKLANFSRKKHPSTLTQLPATILNLFGIKVNLQSTDRYIIGEPDNSSLNEIVIRDTVNGKTYVSLKGRNALDKNTRNKNVADVATRIFTSINDLESTDGLVCYHRSNSWAKAIRGSLVTPCLEFDVFVEDNGTISIHHPPLESTGLQLKELLQIALMKNVGMWIDAKNINNPDACNRLSDQLATIDTSSTSILVEFPSTTKFDNKRLAQCAGRLKKIGAYTSYYVPTSLSTACSDNILKYDSVKSVECKQLQEKLLKVKNSRMFTDLSFDVRGLSAMKKLQPIGEFYWNTWGVNAEELQEIDRSLFRMIIVQSSDDPNQI